MTPNTSLKGLPPPVDESIMEVPLIEKAMMEELLLITQNMGTVDDDGEIVRSETCNNWLADLQKALTRDDADNRQIANTLCTWNIVQKKLVPLLKSSKDDSTLVATTLKIFFMLTKVLFFVLCR